MHPAHGSNVLLDRTFVWGEVDKDFAASPRKLSLRVKWGRSATVPIETFGVVANGTRGARCSTSGPRSRCRSMPTRSRARCACPAQRVRVHYDVDVGGSYGVKRGIKHTVLAGYLARRLGFPCG